MWAILAGVSTVFGLSAVLGALYFRLARQKNESSLTTVLQGEAIAGQAQIVEILKTMTSDEARIQALQALLDYDRERAESLVRKIKRTVDLERFAKSQGQTRHLVLLISGGVCLILGLVSGLQSCHGEFQKVTLSGVVTASGGQPLAGARVTVDGYDFSAESDADGRFVGTINGLRKGEDITIRVLHRQHGREMRTLRVNNDDVQMNVQLNPNPSSVTAVQP
jgi:hypothetical protein